LIQDNQRSKFGSTVAQSWRVQSRRPVRARPALDSAALERLALGYAGRYATSRAKLADYLRRKLGERGWDGEADPPVAGIVERFAELGYVDDRALADAKGRTLGARGYGERRLAAALGGLGIVDSDARPAREQAAADAWGTALRFAERKRIGPFADHVADEKGRRRAFGAMIRAGHSLDHARRIVGAAPGTVPEPDEY
jgi:regulatory protein